MKNLTKRQEEILFFIKTFIAKNSYPPTIREIALFFKISTKGAYDHIKALEKKEAIICNAKKSRAIEIVQDDNSYPVPLLKELVFPHYLSEENFVTFLKPSKQFFKTLQESQQGFALCIKDAAFTNDEITFNDLVFFIQLTNPSNSSIVLAYLHEEFVLKRYFNEGSRIRFEDLNTDKKSIYTTSARIMGQLVGLVRSYER